MIENFFKRLFFGIISGIILIFMLYILGAASELFVMIGNIFSEEPKPLLIPLLWKFTTFAGFMKIGSSVGGVIGSTVGMISIFLHTSAEEERIEMMI